MLKHEFTRTGKIFPVKLPVYHRVWHWTDFITKFVATITGIDAEVLAGEVRKRRGTVFMHEKGEVGLFLKHHFRGHNYFLYRGLTCLGTLDKSRNINIRFYTCSIFLNVYLYLQSHTLNHLKIEKSSVPYPVCVNFSKGLG